MDLALATDTITAAGNVITAACRREPDRDVPSCPGWTVEDLTTHTARIHRWGADLISGGDPGPLPDAPSTVVVADWADECRAALLASMAASDPDREVWTFVGPRPTAWWWRRQANESAVHAWDATASSDTPWSIPPEIADDSLDEVLSVFLPRRWGHKAPSWGEGRTVHLHRTDGDGEWLVTIGSDPTIERSHAKGDLAVRGPIADLLMWSLGRHVGQGPAVEIFGDTTLAEDWKANVRI